MYCCCSCCDTGVPNDITEKSNPLSQALSDSSKWKTGDILIEHFPHPMFIPLQATSNSSVTHVGVLYKDPVSGHMTFIEAVAEGVKNYEIKAHINWALVKKGVYIGTLKLAHPFSSKNKFFLTYTI